MVPSGPVFMVMGPELDFIDITFARLRQTIVQWNIEQDGASKHARQVDRTSNQ